MRPPRSTWISSPTGRTEPSSSDGALKVVLLESMAQLDPDAVAGSAAEERTAGMAGLAMRLK
ncbi:MAG: hypothetical protein ACXWGS_01310 [Solirubrobacterales bacterium]